MNLPNVIEELVKAQNLFDSSAYTDCFSETAIVIDEEQTYNGRNEIKQWIEDANRQYKITMEVTKYSETDLIGILTAKVSGDFEGSPVLLDYHFEIADNKIVRLEITISSLQG